METIEQSNTKTTSFVNHVLNFDAETKGDIMNLIQYSVLAIIPVILLNKLIQNYVPAADDNKGSLEITAEVLIQLSILLSGMFFINRLVTYLPTYSGKKLESINLINMILSFLIIVLGLQTKLGEKVEILSNRVIELWTGPSEEPQQQAKNIVKVRQPITQQIPTHQPSQSDNLARNMNIPPPQAPMPPVQAPMPPTKAPISQQTSPGLSEQMYENSMGAHNVDNMYQESMQPMAANEALGGFAAW